MKTIASFINIHDAHLLRIQLETSHIPAVIMDEISTSVLPQMALACGGIRVQVPDEYIEKAQKIVRENQIQANIKSGFICPSCGSGNVKQTFKRRNKFFSVFFLLLAMVYLPFTKKKYCCLDCNYIWRQ